MSNLFKKASLPYLVASSLATLTLISSLVLAVIPRVPFPLILALAALFVLVIALSCRTISSNNPNYGLANKERSRNGELL
ncbi:MAG: hypothetical protein LKM45_03770, partial [Wolbachia endosymbiont of Alcedoecus sp.]|nr:hypothetical protein [Wolbachia endosymbiont of Alcedoecus sp.]